VSKIDIGNLEVIKSKIPVGMGPHGIAFSEDGKKAYISNMKSNDVSIIDTSTDKVIDTIPGGGIEPHQIVMKKALPSNS
jgi:YVTN family beta-propeller protein